MKAIVFKGVRRLALEGNFKAREGVIPGHELEDLVTHQMSLEEHEKAFGLLAGGNDNTAYGVMKVVIRSA